MNKIKVICVGGYGINAIRRLQEQHLNTVEYIAIDADEKCLYSSQADIIIKIEKGTFYKEDFEESEGQ